MSERAPLLTHFALALDDNVPLDELSLLGSLGARGVELSETAPLELRVVRAPLDVGGVIAHAERLRAAIDVRTLHAPQLDARVRDVLRRVGMIGDGDELPLHLREDDELCAELRALQRGLKERVKVNSQRKHQIATRLTHDDERARFLTHRPNARERAHEQTLQQKLKAAARRKKVANRKR